MTIDHEAGPNPATPHANQAPGDTPRRRRRRLATALAGFGLVVIGAGAGATGYGLLHRGPPTFDTGMPTTPIAELKNSNRTEIQGKVVEIFGNKVVLEDGTGRALVETGRAGEGGTLVAADETVTVQGRFEKGFVQASSLQRADGTVEELRPLPPAPPPHMRP